MISTTEAKRLLCESIEDLKQRNAYLSQDDYAADIINVACRYFIKRGTGFTAGPNAMAYYFQNYPSMSADVSAFVGSIRDSYPSLINSATIESLTQNICLNLGWDGMPGFLDEYFYQKHGQRPSGNVERYNFISSYHKRYEYGTCTQTSSVDREVSLTFTENKNKMSVVITPSLSRKESRLQSKSGSTYTYIGNDPDYRFVVTFDSSDDISHFSLELIPRHLRLEYFE